MSTENAPNYKKSFAVPPDQKRYPGVARRVPCLRPDRRPARPFALRAGWPSRFNAL